MKTKSFLRIEEPLSALGFGCWGISGSEYWTSANDKDSIKTIHTAIDQGIHFFDVAPIYGFGHAETILGKAIKGKQDDVFIASKCGLVWDKDKNVANKLTEKSIRQEVEDSLQRLGVEVIDLLQLHWPDPNTPLQDTISTLAKLKEEGKIRYLGLSNYSLSDLMLADEVAEIASFQGLYNVLEHNPKSYHNIELSYQMKSEILPFAKEKGLMVLPYSPLMQGLLTDGFCKSVFSNGKGDKTDVRNSNPNLRGEKLALYLSVSKDLQAWCGDNNRPLSHLAINWLVSQEEIGPIITGGFVPEHVTENAAALTWTLSSNDIAEIEALLKPLRDAEML